ncbi:MAG: hypothetical protein K8I27_03665 [Planctomycetes bacterium]|nr:hypothetical protein [Planctomycetota bacterium]
MVPPTCTMPTLSVPALTVDRSGNLVAGTDSVGIVQVGGTMTFFYTATNTGTAPLSFTGNPRVAISGASNCTAVVTQQLPAGLAASGSAPFAVSVTPVDSGVLSFTITIASNDPNSPFTLSVQGSTTVIPPSFAKSPNGADGGCVAGEGQLALPMLALIALAYVTRRRRRMV